MAGNDKVGVILFSDRIENSFRQKGKVAYSENHPAVLLENQTGWNRDVAL